MIYATGVRRASYFIQMCNPNTYSKYMIDKTRTERYYDGEFFIKFRNLFG